MENVGQTAQTIRKHLKYGRSQLIKQLETIPKAGAKHSSKTGAATRESLAILASIIPGIDACLKSVRSMAKFVDSLESQRFDMNEELKELRQKVDDRERELAVAGGDKEEILRGLTDVMLKDDGFKNLMKSILGLPSVPGAAVNAVASGSGGNVPPISPAKGKKKPRKSKQKELDVSRFLCACLKVVTDQMASQNLVHFYVKYYIGMEAKNTVPKLTVEPAPEILASGAWPESGDKLTTRIHDADGVLREVWRPVWTKVENTAYVYLPSMYPVM